MQRPGLDQSSPISPIRQDRFTFPRVTRLTLPAEYAAALKSRISIRGPRFALHLHRNDLSHWRLGLVVPKRFAARAIDRNTIKRLWREAFRQSRHRFEAVTADPVDQHGFDLIVRLLPPSDGKSRGRKKGKGNPPAPRPGIVAARRDGAREAAMLLEQLLCQLQRQIQRQAPSAPDPIPSSASTPCASS